MKFKIYTKLIIIFFSIYFFSGQIIMAQDETVFPHLENTPINTPLPVASPSALPSSELSATQITTPPPVATPIVIIPPPAFTPLPVRTSTPLPAVTQVPAEATVMLYYRPLIKVYSDAALSASERAYIVEKRLEEVLERTETVPEVKIDNVAGTPVLESEGVYLISITSTDASYNKTSVGQLAAMWRDELQKGLETAIKEGSKDYEKEAIRSCLIVIIAGILLTVIVVIVWHRWFKIPSYFTLFILWLLVISYIFWVFPKSRSWAKGISDYILDPMLTMSIIIMMINLLSRPVDMFIRHYFELTKKLRGYQIEDARGLHRLTMYNLVISTFVRTGLYIIGGLIFLESLQVNLITGLTGAGIIGVGLGLAAQDLIKDVIAGTFIVLEDQFAIGDTIRAGSFIGTVEAFNMRVTRIRNMEGCLITIPNSSIRAIENFSSTWSQIDCVVGVAYDTDLKEAMGVMVETGRKLKEDYPEKILEEPVMLGVNDLADSSVKLRMLLKTAPSEQWQLKRELFLRIKNKFDEKGIEIAFPQLTVWMNEAKDGKKGA